MRLCGACPRLAAAGLLVLLTVWVSAAVAGNPADQGPAEQAHEHDHAGAAGLELSLDETGAKWPTDESLRAGMASIGEAFSQHLPAFRQGRMSASAQDELALHVDGEVQRMFRQCRLPPLADAQLHKLLARTLTAAQALAEQRADVGMPGLHRVLLDYGKFFDDPNWSLP
jgi:hypothetical protein